VHSNPWCRPTALAACGDQLAIAVDDKCIRVVSIEKVEALENAPVIGQKRPAPSKLIKPTGNQNNAKPVLQGHKNDKSNDIEKPLFSIVRSRVFFQQKTKDALAVTEYFTKCTQFQQPETDVPLDVLLLTFHNDSKVNEEEAKRIIDCELSTCLYLERFEFLQKHLLLRLWRGDDPAEVKKTWLMHRDKLVEQQRWAAEFDVLLTPSAGITTTEIASNAAFESLHIRLFAHDGQPMIARVDEYLKASMYVEALCFAKLKSDREAFLRAMTEIKCRFLAAKDR